jgi:hypothetical protein
MEITMSKYSEMMALLEFASKKGEPKLVKQKKDFTFKDFLKFQKEMEEFEKYKKDQEKLNKKEDKKPEPKFTLMQKTAFFALAGPPLGVLYVFGLLGLARSISMAAGVH